MAMPRVYVGSTCYDLKYIRENLKYFVRTIGYEPVLSEEGAVFYDPEKHTHDSCTSEVSNCQLFVLIIGGRFGGRFRKTDKSITNAEYEGAVRHKVPVFALVEQAVYAEHHVFLKNRDNPDVDEAKIVYPAVDSTKIFSFIDAVRKAAVNNALVPFQDFNDIESYLKKQWAGMMFSFLTRDSEAARVVDTLEMISGVNARVEMLSRQILRSVGTDEAKLTTELYDKMLTCAAIRDLSYVGCHPTPRAVLTSSTFEECAEKLGQRLSLTKEGGSCLSGSGRISKERFASNSEEYKKLRGELEQILESHGQTAARFLEGADST